MKTPIQPHHGSAVLRNNFNDAYAWLQGHPDTNLETARGTPFTALATSSSGREVIRFFQRLTDGTSREYGRAYQCCWHHYYNCNRTRIRMYCEALDDVVR